MKSARALFSLGAIFASACSLYALDGFTGDGSPDAGDDAAPDVAIAPDGSAPPSDAAAADGGSPDPYGDVIRADKPVAWYRFEEDPIANAAKDSVGDVTAALRGGAMGFGAKGISGRGIATDGGAGGFTLGDVFDFAGKKPFTFEMWLRPAPKSGDQHVINKRKTLAGNLVGYIFYLKGASYESHFESWGGDMFAASPSLPAGYVHVVLTISMSATGGNAKLWLNAQPQSDSYGEATSSNPDTDAPLDLLSSYCGEADEIAIYDKALAADRILAHYVAGKQ